MDPSIMKFLVEEKDATMHSGADVEAFTAALNRDIERNTTSMAATRKAPNAMNRPSGKQVPFVQLLPVIEPQLDNDRAMQLQGLYARLRNNNINKEEFIRHLRLLVGDPMLKMAVYRLQQRRIPPLSIHQSLAASSLPMENNPQNSRLLEHQSNASFSYW